jgi:hypothetical protein
MLGQATEPELGEAELAAEDVDGDVVALIHVRASSRIRLA